MVLTQRASIAMALACSVMLLFSAMPVIGAEQTVPDLWKQGGSDGWTGWSMEGAVETNGRVRIDAATALIEPRDGAPVSVASIVSPVRSTLFDELVPSWNVHTPAGSWIEVRARIRQADVWTDWYSLGEWSADAASGRRRSVAGQNDDQVRILTDTLRSKRPANGYQVRVDLYGATPEQSPELGLLAVVASSSGHSSGHAVSQRSIAPVSLDVPERSQMIYPGGGEVWCSPTSTSMVMAYWSEMLGDRSLDRPVPEVAAGTYDPVYRGNGNWPFNTAYAGSAGLHAYVARGASLHDVERWLEVGVPVVASLGWAAGQIPEAPIASTNGHLLVITGITERGDVVVNDPAADPRRGQRVRRVYNRASFESLWLSHSGGTIYIIHPVGVSPRV